MAKPIVRCSEGRLSPTKARKGSIATLKEASIIHNIPTAIQSMAELGIINKAIQAKIAPNIKKGLRLPHVECQVLSLI